MNARDKLIKARTQVSFDHAFFGFLLLRQTLVETDQCKTMATDGKQLYYNPAFVDSLPMAQLKGVCVHEALHPAMQHHTRRGDRDPNTWNEAADYAINPIVLNAGLVLPDGALVRDDFAGLDAVRIYNLLLAERQQQDNEPESDDDEQQDDQHDDGDDAESSDGEDSSDETDDSDTSDDASDDGDDSDDADDGDASGDDDGDGEQQGNAPSDDAGDAEGGDIIPDFGGCGAVIDASDDANEIAEEAADWQEAVSAAELHADEVAAGTIAGGLREAIKQAREPQRDWRALLREYMTEAARADYSWQRPNRRFVSGGLVLPSLYAEGMGPVAVNIDASGSMPRHVLADVLAEVQAICTDIAPEFIDVRVHDSRVSHVERFEPGEDIDVPLTSGGTYFEPVVADMEDSGEQYAVCLWFTDLFADLECLERIDAPLLLLDYSFGVAERAGLIPPYGEVIDLAAA